MQNLQTLPCTVLKGVGEKLQEKLSHCKINSIQDLLFHLPFRYQDRTRITPMHALQPGEYAVIEGTIAAIDTSKSKREILTLRLQDNYGFISLRFFHYTFAQKNSFKIGMKLICFGEVRFGYQGKEMTHPEYRILSATQEAIPVEETLTPIYPSTEGLSQKTLRQLTKQALMLLENQDVLKDFLPDTMIKDMRFPALKEALLYVHRPPPNANQALLLDGKHPVQQRLAFEELLAHHLSLRQQRLEIKTERAAPLKENSELTQKFLKQLPFALTNAQQKVFSEIAKDMALPEPSMRLIQGDVGSGKTVVAALAILQAIANGYQAALMAPTDLLAEQHYVNLTKWFTPLGISVAWLAGKHKGKTRANTLQEIVNHDAPVIVGTHALFQEGVEFAKLALIVIDEQHRFGVHQRLALREKGRHQDLVPHQLIMTATPIPRTLAMTAYADLDVSVIDELPPGRTPVKTVVVPNEQRLQTMERIRQACLTKKQAYWVCTLIEESELLQAQAAETLMMQLNVLLADLRIGLVHGRMKADEKEAVMHAFKQHELDLLVATTVVEVGVDVPNASIMVIENAERLGLSQLHQLRGRVGRGSVESFCVLLYQSPLSNHAKQRLHVMRDTNDGFKIAEEDLLLRGPGELLGTKQTGLVRFKIADLQRDAELIPKVQAIADDYLIHYPADAEQLIKRWFVAGERYADV